MSLNREKIRRILDQETSTPKSYSLLYHTLQEQEAWFANIHEDRSYEPMIAEVKAEATRLLEEPLEEISYTLFKQFEETGSRLEYEKVYFEKKKAVKHFCLNEFTSTSSSSISTSITSDSLVHL